MRGRYNHVGSGDRNGLYHGLVERLDIYNTSRPHAVQNSLVVNKISDRDWNISNEYISLVSNWIWIRKLSLRKQSLVVALFCFNFDFFLWKKNSCWGVRFYICDVIKQNESELANIGFQIEPIIVLNFLVFDCSEHH